MQKINLGLNKPKNDLELKGQGIKNPRLKFVVEENMMETRNLASMSEHVITSNLSPVTTSRFNASPALPKEKILSHQFPIIEVN